jgi:outer membrane protein OmpA-like peptidoglycan-associated protein
MKTRISTKQTAAAGIAVGLAVVAVLGACASAPRDNAKLDTARLGVAAAHADSSVRGDANVEMGKADAALSRASTSLDNGAPATEVDHQAYLADRYARAARAHGALLGSTADIAQQENRRNAVVIEARDTDVRIANAKAQDSAAGLLVANDRAAALAADLAALKAKPTDRGDVITLGDVLFATGRSELQGSADRSIDALSAFLAGHPERLVRIEGFTDSVGSEAANQGLSERRASAVASALSRRGVASQRVAIQGYGESFPIASNETATGRQENRRVEVIISGGDVAVIGRSH